MLDLKWIREHSQELQKGILEKRISCDLETLLKLDQEVLFLKRELQGFEEKKNQNAKQVPQVSAAERPVLIQRGRELNEAIEKQRVFLRQKEEQLQEILYQVPNIAAPEAPRGASDAENLEIKRGGAPRLFSHSRDKDHVELLRVGEGAEFERVTKVAGSRSYALRGEAARLEMALLSWAMDFLIEKGFTLFNLPAFAKEGSLVGTGHFPTARDQVYCLKEEEELFLSGTAEVPLNFLHSGEILSEKDLPLKYAGFSTCFRREAGSAGKDTRGLMRVHQFFKVEQFIICRNQREESHYWHEVLLKNSEEILQQLELPYRILDVCTGDMGAGKIRQYDLEAWVPSENRYRETHSCSALGDWQARRTNLRYRDESGEVLFCHTLNNTALATPRILVPLLENHQLEGGGIHLPKVIQPYLGGRSTLLTPKVV